MAGGVSDVNSEYVRKGIVGLIFFFKQKTAYEMCGRDWSSDVCSSDLISLKETENNTLQRSVNKYDCIFT